MGKVVKKRGTKKRVVKRKGRVVKVVKITIVTKVNGALRRWRSAMRARRAAWKAKWAARRRARKAKKLMAKKFHLRLVRARRIALLARKAFFRLKRRVIRRRRVMRRRIVKAKRTVRITIKLSGKRSKFARKERLRLRRAVRRNRRKV